jgi:hypothetical protein
MATKLPPDLSHAALCATPGLCTSGSLHRTNLTKSKMRSWNLQRLMAAIAQRQRDCCHLVPAALCVSMLTPRRATPEGDASRAVQAAPRVVVVLVVAVVVVHGVAGAVSAHAAVMRYQTLMMTTNMWGFVCAFG